MLIYILTKLSNTLSVDKIGLKFYYINFTYYYLLYIKCHLSLFSSDVCTVHCDS
jgi:hypothetical protein